MSLAQLWRLPYWLTLCAACCALASCADYVTRKEFDDFVKIQEKWHKEQSDILEDISAALTCSDEVVQDFVSRCHNDDTNCDATQLVSVVERMVHYSHAMLRLPYVPGRPLAITEDMDQTKLKTLFFTDHRYLPTTKLLIVALPSHQLHGFPQASGRGSRHAAARLPAPRYWPDIPADELKTLLRNLRTEFLKPPYSLTPKIINGMQPQVPACEHKSDKLIEKFRSKSDNLPSLQEKKMRAPYVELILFLVDCK